MSQYSSQHKKNEVLSLAIPADYFDLLRRARAGQTVAGDAALAVAQELIDISLADELLLFCSQVPSIDLAQVAIYFYNKTAGYLYNAEIKYLSALCNLSVKEGPGRVLSALISADPAKKSKTFSAIAPRLVNFRVNDPIYPLFDDLPTYISHGISPELLKEKIHLIAAIRDLTIEQFNDTVTIITDRLNNSMTMINESRAARDINRLPSVSDLGGHVGSLAVQANDDVRSRAKQLCRRYLSAEDVLVIARQERDPDDLFSWLSTLAEKELKEYDSYSSGSQVVKLIHSLATEPEAFGDKQLVVNKLIELIHRDLIQRGNEDQLPRAFSATSLLNAAQQLIYHHEVPQSAFSDVEQFLLSGYASAVANTDEHDYKKRLIRDWVLETRPPTEVVVNTIKWVTAEPRAYQRYDISLLNRAIKLSGELGYAENNQWEAEIGEFLLGCRALESRDGDVRNFCLYFAARAKTPEQRASVSASIAAYVSEHPYSKIESGWVTAIRSKSEDKRSIPRDAGLIERVLTLWYPHDAKNIEQMVTALNIAGEENIRNALYATLQSIQPPADKKDPHGPST